MGPEPIRRIFLISVRLGTVGTWKFAGEMAISGHAPQESLPESVWKSSQLTGDRSVLRRRPQGPKTLCGDQNSTELSMPPPSLVA